MDPASNSFFLSQVSTAEIREIINTVDPTKSVGPYCISVRILKILKDDITVPLKIINESFSLGIVPSQFKIATIVHVHKKKSVQEVSNNYCPISLLSVLRNSCTIDLYPILTGFLSSMTNSLASAQNTQLLMH